MGKPINKLTTKQQAFIVHYLETYNASEAARRAGYSPKTAAVIGHENLRKPNIKAELEKHIMSPEEISLRLTEAASNAVSAYIIRDEYGNPVLDVAAMKRDNKLHLITAIKVTTAGINIETADPMRAIENLIKIHGMITQKKEVKLNVSELSDDELNAIIEG